MSSDKQENRCIVICGPTASGKSALAMKLANELNGEIINADSLQVYNELKILTSRPSINDTENIPHNLFGIRKMVEPCSVNIWIKLEKKSISQIIDRGRIPIACGERVCISTIYLKGCPKFLKYPTEFDCRHAKD